MSHDTLMAAWRREEQQPFSGWDFAHLAGRMREDHPPWSYSSRAAEIARILTPGGTFLTQQVHGLWGYDLLAMFDATPQWPDAAPEKYVPRLQQAGLTMIAVQDWSGALTFADVGAIVYYLKAIPWLVPRFSVTTHARHLQQLQRRLDRGKQLTFVAKQYLIEARKPA